jgi:hypothetical protein
MAYKIGTKEKPLVLKSCDTVVKDCIVQLWCFERMKGTVNLKLRI